MSEFMVRQMIVVREAIERLRKRESGQGMVEYALILAFIAILVIVALKFLQPAISTTLNTVSNSL
jgi:pilus assembly protein Flp/PilA